MKTHEKKYIFFPLEQANYDLLVPGQIFSNELIHFKIFDAKKKTKTY
jgi:hypothetical protein